MFPVGFGAFWQVTFRECACRVAVFAAEADVIALWPDGEHSCEVHRPWEKPCPAEEVRASQAPADLRLHVAPYVVR